MPSKPRKNDHMLSCMSSLLCTPDEKMTYIIKSCQRQSNGYDCGVFAIAFAISLANGEDPTTRLYNQKKLRAHLVDCMASGILTPFPSDSIRAKRSKGIVQKEKVFCACSRTGWERNGLSSSVVTQRVVKDGTTQYALRIVPKMLMICFVLTVKHEKSLIHSVPKQKAHHA